MRALFRCRFSRGLAGQETRTAIDRTSLRRIKRDGGLLPALRALHGDFNSLSHSRRLGCCNGREPFVFCLLTRLAPFWFVPEAFVVEEHLIAGCPDKVLVAVDTSNRPILVFAVWRHFQCVNRFRLCHDLLPGSITYKMPFSGGQIKNNTQRGVSLRLSTK